MQAFDFLIVGQGLAGSLLSYSLIKRGKTVLVLDHEHHACATQVAAGLINPITGHRLNITDHFFDYSSEAKKLYWHIERDLGCSIYRELAQTRLIKNRGQADFLSQRLTQTEYTALLDDLDNTDGWFSNKNIYPFGSINVSQTAAVDTKVLLHCMRNWLQERNSLKTETFDYSAIMTKRDAHETLVEYHGHTLSVKAKKIIFCEGHQALRNPWLTELPFKLSKGEVITIKPEKAITRMLSWGKWFVPNSNGDAKLGSNYIWNDTTLTPQADTAETLMADFLEHTALNAKLIQHEVGIRPSTTQRKPFVGPLSNLKQAYCFNGLGSKGCLIAPYYTKLLCDHLLTGQSLPNEVTQWL